MYINGIEIILKKKISLMIMQIKDETIIYQIQYKYNANAFLEQILQTCSV